MVNVPSQYQTYVNNAAAQLGIPASVVAAQISTESGFDPHAVSPAGAQGIAQFMPGTWSTYGTGSPFNASDAFTAYVKYMKVLLRQEGGSVYKALEAYNAGPGNLSAGSSYASSILSLAGTGTNITQGSATGTVPVSATQASWYDPSTWGSDIENAVEQTILKSLMAVIEPFLKVVWYAGEVLIGGVLLVAGAMVIAQKSPAVEKDEGEAVKVVEAT